MGVDLRPVVPALIVAVTGVFVLLAQAFAGRGRRSPSMPLSVLGLAGALASVLILAARGVRGATLGGAYVLDDFSLFLHGLILAVAIVAVLIAPSYLRATGAERGEYYALVLFSVVGMLGLVSCLELVALFVALEIMSVALYAAAGLHRARPESTEAAMKYFLTGAFSSSFFLYGVALLGTALLLVGFGFKVASVPFHMWAPDVYEGAPTTLTALMAAGVKAAAFGGFVRVFLRALPGLAEQWAPAMAALAALTMVVGNLGALAQSNLKRMLAYSSVAHAGYLLTALVAGGGPGTQAVLFYLVAYAVVNLGGFGALAALARDGREPLVLDDVAGLARRRPALAAAIAIYMISLTGVPVSAGFVGKFYLFRAAVDADYVTLAIVGFLTSVISAYYYLRVVVAMYMRDPVREDSWATVSPPAAAALAFSAIVVLGLGVYPGPLLDWAGVAARSVM